MLFVYKKADIIKKKTGGEILTGLEMLAFILAFLIAIFLPRTMFALVLSIVLGWPWYITAILTIGGVMIDVVFALLSR